MEYLKDSAEYKALAYFWGGYRDYAATSRKRKRILTRWQLVVLVLILSGAAFGVISQQLTDLVQDQSSANADLRWISRMFAALSAVSIGLAAYFSREVLKPEREQNTIRARSAAEAFKSEAYKYVTQTRPYHGSDAPSLLHEKAQELVKKVHADIPLERASEDDKKETIPQQYPLSVDDYIENRVKEQIHKYYYRNSYKYKKYLERWAAARLSLGVIAFVLGILNGLGTFTVPGGWIAVISTATTAIASHIATHRYGYLVLSYQSTAQRLEWLLGRWDISDKTEEDKEQLVLDCESSISIENKAWVIEWSKKEESVAGMHDTGSGK